MHKPHRERLVERHERIRLNDTEPINLVFFIKHQSEDLYLRRLAYVAMKEEEKWMPLDWADKFITRQGALMLGKRILGHDNFTIMSKHKE